MIHRGKHSYGGGISRGNANDVNIGKFCSIAEGVIFDGGFQHDMKNISTFPFHTLFNDIESNITCKGNISIGNDVWIGESACIMSGVTIGDGAVIGLRSIISKDVKPYEVVVGAPQKVLRKRFHDVDIDCLLQMKWWDWTEEQIKVAAPMLMSNRISDLYTFFLTKIS